MERREPSVRSLVLDELASERNFVEDDYLSVNLDVADAVAGGQVPSGLWHFRNFGLGEGRRLRRSSAIDAIRAHKMRKAKGVLKPRVAYERRGLKFDFLTDELIRESGIAVTEAVSSNGYDGYVDAMIADFADGLILDCGAGKRPVYYDNVLNFEIVDYDTTDVLGVGEALPFKGNSFDGVISIAVLEHVRDPFKCASEIIRVLKRGGRLICCVPFLQPEHGYPHHYYNMAPQGLRALFDRSLAIDDHLVIDSILPVWSLKWIAQAWAAGLQGQALAAFRALTMETLIESDVVGLLDAPWVRGLPVAKNFELASATLLLAHKE